MLVDSIATNYDMRQSVRETWMTHPSVGISVIVVFTIAGNQLDTVRSVFNNSETSTYIYTLLVLPFKRFEMFQNYIMTVISEWVILLFQIY